MSEVELAGYTLVHDELTERWGQIASWAWVESTAPCLSPRHPPTPIRFQQLPVRGEGANRHKLTGAPNRRA